MHESELAPIKKAFFTYRNGIVADTLRQAGDAHQLIFGLVLPQLTLIAKDVSAQYDNAPEKLSELAQALWENTTCRESQLLAPMIYPQQLFTEDKAQNWVTQSPNNEVTDVLCMKLLRYLPYAEEFAYSLLKDESNQYAGLRLMVNLLAIAKISDFSRLTQAIKTINDSGPLIQLIREYILDAQQE